MANRAVATMAVMVASESVTAEQGMAAATAAMACNKVNQNDGGGS